MLFKDDIDELSSTLGLHALPSSFDFSKLNLGQPPSILHQTALGKTHSGKTAIPAWQPGAKGKGPTRMTRDPHHLCLETQKRKTTDIVTATIMPSHHSHQELVFSAYDLSLEVPLVCDPSFATLKIWSLYHPLQAAALNEMKTAFPQRFRWTTHTEGIVGALTFSHCPHLLNILLPFEEYPTLMSCLPR